MEIRFTKRDHAKAKKMIEERLQKVVLEGRYDCSVCGEHLEGYDVVQHMRENHQKVLLKAMTEKAEESLGPS